MNKLTALLIVFGLSLMVVSAVKPRHRPVADSGSSDDYYSAVCTSGDRNNQNCMGGYTMGCICYNNGTCENTQVNKCFDCAKLDVFSSLPGKRCPVNQPYLCEAPIPGKKYSCDSNKTESCICTVNGTCTQGQGSHCLDCISTPNTLAVFEGKACPREFLQTPPSKYFIPQICSKTSAKSISCLKTTTPGCTCYSNDTCEYRTDSNQCLLCFDKNVVSFNQGEYCPKLNSKLHVCGAEGASGKCSGTKSSCVCKQDGTCSQEKTNRCNGCKIQGAVGVIEGGSCALAKYVTSKL